MSDDQYKLDIEMLKRDVSEMKLMPLTDLNNR